MNSHHSWLSFSRAFLPLMVACGFFLGMWIKSAQATPRNSWAAPPDQIEVLRDYGCFDEGRAGERTTMKTVTFSRPVVSAEVFLSGFNLWQTRGGDTEVRQIRVDSWVDAINVAPNNPPGTRSPGLPDPKSVRVKLMYMLVDEDPTGSEDFNDACIGFTVIARTQ